MLLNNGHISLNNDAIVATCMKYINDLNIQPALDGTISTHSLAVAKHVNIDSTDPSTNIYRIDKTDLEKSNFFQQPHD